MKLGDMKCAVCNRSAAEGIALYRMNARGGLGLWSCNEHKDRFDGRVPADVLEITKLIERGR